MNFGLPGPPMPSVVLNDVLRPWRAKPLDSRMPMIGFALPSYSRSRRIHRAMAVRPPIHSANRRSQQRELLKSRRTMISASKLFRSEGGCVYRVVLNPIDSFA